jgi:hypothetical protein
MRKDGSFEVNSFTDISRDIIPSTNSPTQPMGLFGSVPKNNEINSPPKKGDENIGDRNSKIGNISVTPV